MSDSDSKVVSLTPFLNRHTTRPAPTPAPAAPSPRDERPVFSLWFQDSGGQVQHCTVSTTAWIGDLTSDPGYQDLLLRYASDMAALLGGVNARVEILSSSTVELLHD